MVMIQFKRKQLLTVDLEIEKSLNSKNIITTSFLNTSDLASEMLKEEAMDGTE